MIKDFDMSTYKKFSSRDNSESYISKDGTNMVKFPKTFNANYIHDMEKECNTSKVVSNLGILTPKVYDLIETKERRIGLLCQYIENKKSLCTAVREDISYAKNAGIKLAKMAKHIHETKCDTKYFVNIKDNIRIGCDTFIKDSEVKNFIIYQLSKIKDTDTCLHADLNFSNVITTGNKDYLIDLGLFCYGNPIFDLGIYTVFCGKLISPKNAQHQYRLKLETINEMHEACVLEYFGLKDIRELDDTIDILYLIGCFGLLYHALYIEAAYGVIDLVIKNIKEYM